MSALEDIPPRERDHISVIPPPPGVSSNLLNPPNHGPQLLVAATFLLGFTVFFFAFRVYAKLFLARKVWWDDLTCVLSFIGTVIIYGCFVYDVFEGPNGKHLWDVSAAAMLNEQYSITAYIYQVTFSPANYFIKLSVFLLYLQLFWPNRWIRIWVYAGIAFTTAFYVSITIVTTYLLTPKGDNEAFSVHMWSFEQQKALVLFVPIAVVGLIIDVFLLVLPVKPVLGLEISWKRKCTILFVFMSGIFATVGSSCSIYYRVKIAKTMDTTWYFAYAQIMTLIELLGGIICVCMPSVSKTLRHHSRHIESLFRRHPAPRKFPDLTGDNDRRFQTRQRGFSTDKGRRPTIGTMRLETLPNQNVVRIRGVDCDRCSECYRPRSYATQDSRRQLLLHYPSSRMESCATSEYSDDTFDLTRGTEIYATTDMSGDAFDLARRAESFATIQMGRDPFNLTRRDSIV